MIVVQKKHTIHLMDQVFDEVVAGARFEHYHDRIYTRMEVGPFYLDLHELDHWTVTLSEMKHLKLFERALNWLKLDEIFEME